MKKMMVVLSGENFEIDVQGGFCEYPAVWLTNQSTLERWLLDKQGSIFNYGKDKVELVLVQTKNAESVLVISVNGLELIFVK